MIIYYASYKLAKEIFDSSSGLQLHDFPACSMYRLETKRIALLNGDNPVQTYISTEEHGSVFIENREVVLNCDLQ